MPITKAINGNRLLILKPPLPINTENKVTASNEMTSSIMAADNIIAPTADVNFFCSAKTANVIDIDVAEKTIPENKETDTLYPIKINAIGNAIIGITTPMIAINDEALTYFFIVFISDANPELSINIKIPISDST